MAPEATLRESLVHALSAVAGGLALASAFPRTDWSGAAWVALAPTLVMALATKPRVALGLGWLAGCAFFVLLLRWLNFTFRVYSAIPWPVTWLPTLMLAAYCGLFVGMFAWALSWTARARGAGLALVLAPFFWVATEWLRGHLFGGFPWGSLGYSQYRHLALIQISELGGFYAVSFVVVAVNAALAGCAILRSRRAAVGVVVAVVLVAASFGFGLARLAERPAATEEPVVAVIQPAIAQPLKWDANYAASTLGIYYALTEHAGSLPPPMHPQLIVWPETATPTVLRRDPALLTALRAHSRTLGVALLVGSIDVDDSQSSRPRNSAFLLTERGLEGRYDKMQLVPFGEFVPLSGVIGFVRGWADFISDLEPGTRAVVFPGPPAPFGVVICYEGIFPDLVRRFVLGGARFMVNMTNDAWFGQTSGPLQHLAMYPFRAVEHRTAIVRSANTGVSAFISPRGEIVRSLELFERGTLVDRVPLRARQTLYTRLGDWLPYLALVVSGLAIALATWEMRA